jgi:hypothetical protein
VVLHHGVQKLLQNIGVQAVSLKFMAKHLEATLARLVKDHVVLAAPGKSQAGHRRVARTLSSAAGLGQAAGDLRTSIRSRSGLHAVLPAESPARPKRHGNNNMFLSLYHGLLIDYPGTRKVAVSHQAVYLMNVKARPMFAKEEGIYKVVEDFRKLKVFEVNCAPSCSHYRTALGSIRQPLVGNARIAAALNGGLVRVEDVDVAFLRSAIDFEPLTRLAAVKIGGHTHVGEAEDPSLAGAKEDGLMRKATMPAMLGLESTASLHSLDRGQTLPGRSIFKVWPHDPDCRGTWTLWPARLGLRA